MNDFVYFKPRPPEPKPEIKHYGTTPPYCMSCYEAATEFIVRHTPTNASVSFYCLQHSTEILREQWPDGEPQEPL